ncbi:hypothetical protein [Aldersonia kunmingensis]|uniref:hypothetical protein n=1 Tax=Aldersonia kunmingensis TaxID=408066 RepID=UPI0008369F4E|nr:hypothetical protein [Aldersonia kunmingensis]
MRKAIVVVALIAGWLAAMAIPAGAADPSWSGQYSLKRFAASKTGTSLAARQPEPDFSDVYTFETTCTNGTCVATVTDGPTPANPTLPLPPRYTWDGASWVHTYDWEWDCWQGEGVPKVWAPAHSVAVYTPQSDGTLTGTWRTVIDSGACEGDVIMNVAAYPVAAPRPSFGSS